MEAIPQQIFWRLLWPLAPYMGVPGTFSLISGLLPISHSPENCELALCPVYYAQVWLLVTTYLTPTAQFVGIPSATWGTFAFPVTCKNGNLHFAPSVDAHWVSAWQSRLICMDRATLSSFSQPPSTCTINTALINYGGKKAQLAREWRLSASKVKALMLSFKVHFQPPQPAKRISDTYTIPWAWRLTPKKLFLNRGPELLTQSIYLTAPGSEEGV